MNADRHSGFNQLRCALEGLSQITKPRTLAWVVNRNKENRDRISKAVMEDPQLKVSMDPSKIPFDGKRIFWGGFETNIGLSADN